jgi:hypothetical protein
MERADSMQYNSVIEDYFVKEDSSNYDEFYKR